MRYLPLFVDLQRRPCLLLGAGEVALRKLETLLRAGASVHVVALRVDAGFRVLAEQNHVEISERAFVAADLSDIWLVVAATGDKELNATLIGLCFEQRIWLNIVDETPGCSAIFPSIIDRDPVLVAVSTAGRSPTLARLIRGWIDELLPLQLGRLAEFIGVHRQRVSARLASVRDRQHLWEKFLGRKPLRELIDDVTQGTAAEHLSGMLEGRAATGQVALVGAGPGDPELLTIRGLNLLRCADVILYDNLVNASLLEYARRDAEKIYVGKKRAFKGIRQEEINRLMVSHARSGASVVRLKGGDPFIFGRGGEEIEWLAQHEIDFVVVPGISAALGGASYAGIPLTHRTISQSVRFVTGHRASDRANLDWPEMAKPDQTLVIYMGLPALADILAELIGHGLDPQTPAALIERATLPSSRVIEGTAATLPEQVAQAQVRGPTLIIVGQVVAHRVTSGKHS